MEMRIFHVLNHCNHGHGNAHVAVDLACAQADAGHDVFYLSAGGDYQALLTSKGVQHICLRQSLRAPMLAVKSLRKLVAFCQRIKPDIMHAHMMSGAVLGYIATRLAPTRLVTTVHNSFDRHSFLMRLGDRVVAVSEAERRLLVDRGFAPDRIDVVLNGPNLSPRESLGEGSVSLRRPCITTVCGIHRRKGVSDLLQAFHHVREKSPDWSLNIIGDGPDRSLMESLADTLGLRSSVHFLGYLPSAREALLQTDIFVLASYADPCSLALAEARYAGCALVATRVGGTPELLGFGQHGALVPPGDINALADALIELTTNSIMLAERRRAACVGAGHLTNDRLYLDYLKVYERACAQSR